MSEGQFSPSGLFMREFLFKEQRYRKSWPRLRAEPSNLRYNGFFKRTTNSIQKVQPTDQAEGGDEVEEEDAEATVVGEEPAEMLRPGHGNTLSRQVWKYNF